MLSLRLSAQELLRLYYKYIGVLGSPTSVYRFEAVWHGRAVKTVIREPVQSVRLECTVHNPILTDGPTWDYAAVSLRAIDQNGNLLPYCSEAVQLSVEGPVEILGPSVVPLRGGMAGTYLATTGEAGRGRRVHLAKTKVGVGRLVTTGTAGRSSYRTTVRRPGRGTVTTKDR